MLISVTPWVCSNTNTFDENLNFRPAKFPARQPFWSDPPPRTHSQPTRFQPSRRYWQQARAFQDRTPVGSGWPPPGGTSVGRCDTGRSPTSCRSAWRSPLRTWRWSRPRRSNGHLDSPSQVRLLRNKERDLLDACVAPGWLAPKVTERSECVAVEFCRRGISVIFPKIVVKTHFFPKMGHFFSK